MWILNKIEDFFLDGVIIVGILFPIAGSLLMAHSAWTDWQLRRELAQVGVETTATVQDCNYYRRFCTITYKFPVIVDKQVNGYVGEDRVVCNKCRSIGTPVKIRYISQNPNKSGIEGISWVNYFVIMSIVFLLIYLYMFWSEISSKVKSWLKAYRSNLCTKQKD